MIPCGKEPPVAILFKMITLCCQTVMTNHMMDDMMVQLLSTLELMMDILMEYMMGYMTVYNTHTHYFS